jgi:hypothetical protein
VLRFSKPRKIHGGFFRILIKMRPEDNGLPLAARPVSRGRKVRIGRGVQCPEITPYSLRLAPGK